MFNEASGDVVKLEIKSFLGRRILSGTLVVWVLLFCANYSRIVLKKSASGGGGNCCSAMIENLVLNTGPAKRIPSELRKSHINLFATFVPEIIALLQIFSILSDLTLSKDVIYKLVFVI